MDSKRFSKKLLSLFSLLAILLTGLWAWGNKWEIHDRWVSRSYSATKDSTEVLNNLDLTSKGELVYKASLTEVDDKEKFRLRCPVQRFEQASVLGCYGNRRIYVLKVDEEKLNGIEEVTAAHELLHAMFERMDSSERDRVGVLVNELRGNTGDQQTEELINNYQKNLGLGEELNNEMFAIFGTQLKNVGPELEEIYKVYFKDRASIVDKYFDYNSEFQRLNNIISNYDQRLTELRENKESLESEITILDEELNREKNQIEFLQNSDSQEQYQSAVESYNQKVRLYNSKVEEIRSVIAEYNSIVEKRNKEALSAKSLADKLNANVEER